MVLELAAPRWNILIQRPKVDHLLLHSSYLFRRIYRYKVVVSMDSFPPPRDTTDANLNNDHRRQLNATLQRIRRQSMTEERRQEYLSRRRSNYQQQRYESASNASPNESTFTASNDTPNSIGENVISRRQEQWRILDRRRRNSMTNDERNTYLERRREAYRRRTQPFASSSNEGIVATTLGQVCCTQTILYQTMTSNFHQGSTSTFQRITDLNHQGQHLCIEEVDAIAKYQQNVLWLNSRLHMFYKCRTDQARANFM